MNSPSQSSPSTPRANLGVIIALAVVALLWAGMVLGISVLETPVKFTAPLLTRAVALDVGRTVFRAFGYVEIFWSALSALLILIATRRAALPRLSTFAFAYCWLAVAFQTAVLRPALWARADLVIAGKSLPIAPYHIYYTGSELLKLIALIVAGIVLIKALARRE